MRVGIIGAGSIGGNAARLLAAADHEVKLSFARDRSKLEMLASEIGARVSVGTPAEAVAFGKVVIFSVPWDAIPVALEQAGDLSGKIVIDTTNQFGSGAKPDANETAARFNWARMRGARTRAMPRWLVSSGCTDSSAAAPRMAPSSQRVFSKMTAPIGA